MAGLINLAHQALMAGDIAEKVSIIGEMRSYCDPGPIGFSHDLPIEQIRQPGSPARLQLVHAKELPRRSLHTEEGKAVFLHAIAHIEFNAINLALDAIYRFPNLPDDYYLDWLLVAEQEADHHQRIVSRLEKTGHRYGDFPAHNGLWDMAVRTADDLLSRMAMVPCVFEARGLDVTPPMIKKLRSAGDNKSAEVLEFILQEEVGHVEIGVKWYRYACEQQQLEPINTFMLLLKRYLPNKPQGPFNLDQRKAAGFTSEWLSRLEQYSG